MSDPIRSEILRANERIKAISNAFFNLGTGLTAAIAARVYVTQGFDLVALGWSFGVAALIWVAWKMLYLLEADV